MFTVKLPNSLLLMMGLNSQIFNRSLKHLWLPWTLCQMAQPFFQNHRRSPHWCLLKYDHSSLKNLRISSHSSQTYPIPGKTDTQHITGCMHNLRQTSTEDTTQCGANKQTANPWVFEPEYPRKCRIYWWKKGRSFWTTRMIRSPFVLLFLKETQFEQNQLS